jgi:hypothetical protein
MTHDGDDTAVLTVEASLSITDTPGEVDPSAHSIQFIDFVNKMTKF